jgi:hypothetical protein
MIFQSNRVRIIDPTGGFRESDDGLAALVKNELRSAALQLIVRLARLDAI